MTRALEVNPGRVVADLRELDALTGGRAGARRVAWTDTWTAAREFVAGLCHQIGLSPTTDGAGNMWWTVPGTADRPRLIVGSHLDSVPGGGWLDGALGVLAGVELLRAARRSGVELPSISLVDWADEEGARFGVSLFGSSLVGGALDGAAVAELVDPDGVSLRATVEPFGVMLDRPVERPQQLRDAGAYLELHIEQGPVLERAGRPIAAVSGTVGIDRDSFVITGQAAHAGTTPMDHRHDAFLVAAELALAIEQVAGELGGLATVGRIDLSPGIATAVAGRVELWVDLRHAQADPLACMRSTVLGLASDLGCHRGCTVTRESVWSIEPREFNDRLVQAAIAACEARGGAPAAMVSGALHDAAVVAPHVPTAMIFCASRGGLSHTPEEDSAVPDIELATAAFAELAERALGL